MNKTLYDETIGKYVIHFRTRILPKVIPDITDEILMDEGLDIELEDHIDVYDAFYFNKIKDEHSLRMAVLDCKPYIPEDIMRNAMTDLLNDIDGDVDLFNLAVEAVHDAIKRHIFVCFEKAYCGEYHVV